MNDCCQLIVVSQLDVEQNISLLGTDNTETIIIDGNNTTFLEGATFKPIPRLLSKNELNISWENNRGLPNPTPVTLTAPKGERGEPFKIFKVYSSIEEMNADYPTSTEVPIGGFVIISNDNMEDVDNAKVYVKTETQFNYLVDMSGAKGIQGPEGPQGKQGIQGPEGKVGPQGPKGEDGIIGKDGKSGVELSPTEPTDSEINVWVNPNGTPIEILTKDELLDYMHPIGTIYKTDSPSFNPNTFWGGTWVKLEDVFLLCAGTKHPLGETGGEEKHTLSIDEMPKHSHKFNYDERDHSEIQNLAITAKITTSYRGTRYDLIRETGNSQPHNNMPPYIAVYGWKRTA